MSTEQQPEPSPRPWRIESDNLTLRPPVCFVVDANGAKVSGGFFSRADAALIVDAVNERDHLRDLVWRLAEYADAVTGYRPRTIEVLSSEHPAWTFDGVALLREAREAIGEGAR